MSKLPQTLFQYLPAAVGLPLEEELVDAVGLPAGVGYLLFRCGGCGSGGVVLEDMASDCRDQSAADKHACIGTNQPSANGARGKDTRDTKRHTGGTKSVSPNQYCKC